MNRLHSRARARRIHRRALSAWLDGDRQVALSLAGQALAVTPRGRRLAAVTERINIMFTLAAVASEAIDHRDAVAWLDQAVEELTVMPESPLSSRWLAEILTRLGDAQRLVGDYEDAHTTLTEALTVARGNNTDGLPLAAALNALGILAKETGHYTEASVHYDAALDLLVDELGDADPQLAGLHHNLAGLAHVQGDYAGAEPLIRTALALRARADPPDPSGCAADTAVLGAVLAGQGRLEEAEQVLLEAKTRWVDLRGPDHYEVAVQLHNLASVHQQRGHLTAAAGDYFLALQIKQAVLGNQHQEIAALHHNIACLLAEQGDVGRARAHFDTALKIYAATVGPDHPDARVCAASRRRLSASQ